MSASHPVEHDERLRRLFLEGPGQDSELEAAIAACDTCRVRAEELAGVFEQLEEGGAAERRAVIAEAERLPSAPGEERAVAALERAMAAGDRSRGRGLRIVALIAVAAAAIVVAILSVQALLRGDEGVPENVFAGENDFELRAPVGLVTEFGSFEWEAKVSTGGWFQVFVYDAAELDGRAIIETETEEPRWTPTRQELQLLPERIRWEVRAFESSGLAAGSAEQEAWY